MAEHIPQKGFSMTNDPNVRPLLQIRGLTISIREGNGKYTAVDGVSYDVLPGEILGVVGESGCGKTVTNLAIMGLLPEVLSVTGGKILFNSAALPGEIDLARCSQEQRRNIDGNEISMIYQEPLTSLNPLLRIGRQVGESLRIHHPELPEAEVESRVQKSLAEVGLPDPAAITKMFPHQLSGGMRQRVMIAMATICRPKLMIADEPTTALDVTVQAQVLRLLKHISRKHGMSIIFISHDLAVIDQICDRVIVMYAGRVAESAPVEAIMRAPLHEYTKGLLRSIPQPSLKGTDLPAIKGHVPSTKEHREPCPFAPRCPNESDGNLQAAGAAAHGAGRRACRVLSSCLGVAGGGSMRLPCKSRAPRSGSCGRIRGMMRHPRDAIHSAAPGCLR